MSEYMPILDRRRLDNELQEARRILTAFAAKFASANSNPVRSRHIEAKDVDVRDITAFFERWPVTADAPKEVQ